MPSIERACSEVMLPCSQIVVLPHLGDEIIELALHGFAHQARHPRLHALRIGPRNGLPKMLRLLRRDGVLLIIEDHGNWLRSGMTIPFLCPAFSA